MSQKISKRTRRRTEEELDPEFKAPEISKTKDESPKNTISESDSFEEENKASKIDDTKIETITGENEGLPKRVIQTRSRSNTPLIKLNNTSKDEIADIKDTTNGVINTQQEDDTSAIAVVSEEEVAEAVSFTSTNSVEMDPLVLEPEDEEAIPELQFDENELDIESEGSPSRCKTRRSQTRNISTPKTPKLTDPEELKPHTTTQNFNNEKSDTCDQNIKITPTNTNSQSEENVDLNDTSDTTSSVSIDNISTKAVAGSDATRNTDLTYQDSGLFDDNSSLNSPNVSVGEMLRNLSSRRTIRPILNEDYRKYVLKNNAEYKSDLYGDYESVQNVSSGVKRKHRSISPEESKRFKKESSTLLSYFSSPLNNFKSTFTKSSTPKLIGFEKNYGFDNDDVGKIRLEIDKEDGNKKWCVIM